MMKKQYLLASLLLAGLSANAQVVTVVTNYTQSEPQPLVKPICVDSVDVNGKKLDFTGGFCHEKVFFVNHTDYIMGKLLVKGAKTFGVKLDGVALPADGVLSLDPAHHEFVVNYELADEKTDTVSVSFDANRAVECTTSPRRMYGIHDVLDGLRVSNAEVSPDGNFVIVSYSDAQPGGNVRSYQQVKELQSGRIVDTYEGRKLSWMPRSTAFLYEEQRGDNRLLYKVEVPSGSRSVLAERLPAGAITVSPSEDYLILTDEEKGPAEKKEIFQVLEPDDRQPGWRSRSYLSKYDLAQGTCQRITFGSHSSYAYGISADGRKLLIGVSRSRLEKRPTTVTDYLLVDAQTLKVDTLIMGAEFLGGGELSPDGRQVVFMGSPEAFGGVGKDASAGKYGNMYDYQLFLFDISSRKVTPLTLAFNPSVSRLEWSVFDGRIYFTANDRDYIHLYSLDPKTRRISQMKTGEDVLYGFSLASRAPMAVYTGVSTLNPVRLYSLNLRTGKQKCLEDCATTLLKDVELGTCHDFNFTSSRGDSIFGRYYLQPHFDASKKYPMIVNYYGGCAPTERYFESRYPHAYYASLGYVVYVVNPGGAAGFGQRHSARHVNTAGQGVAEDIIEGVRQFCASHSFVDAKKIGCIGASYGGFMTQYLQTVTDDLFACAVSHAGISNHASYWGEGYWGYSYSEVSMAGQYPWNAKELYTGQSPLFRADKINTPLLLTHGTDDTNVPIIESIQLFTALKLLGRDVALVEVPGENHWIMDYQKRILWSNTIMAWFAKYLKGDSAWWDALYPQKSL
jgi:dipeptidyl aminopeptidase/acylaminoacyl peptidase